MKVQFKKILVPVVAITLLLVMVVWMAGGFTDKVSPNVINAAKTAEGNNSVKNTELFTVKTISSESYEPISATVTAKEATVISSRTIARIDAINVRAGESVKQGQLLISLENKDVQAEVSRASQQVKALSVRLDEANKNLYRTINLQKQNLVSQFNVDKDQANVDALTAELTAAKQALSHTKTVLSYNALKSPIDGVIIDRFAEPGDTAQPGKVLLTLYNPNSLRISAQVRENLAVKLTLGQKVQVQLPSINKTLNATVEEIVPSANVGSRSFLVNVNISAESNLLPGMYAKLLLPTGTTESIRIPVSKVANVGQLTMVWVLVNGEKRQRFIRIAAEQSVNGMVEVISGLSAGDIVLEI